MHIKPTTISITVDDVAASSRFFTTYLGFTEKLAADDAFACLTAQNDGAGIVFVRCPHRIIDGGGCGRHGTGLVLTFSVGDIVAHESRLRAGGAAVTRPLRVESWGERLVEVTDPNGIAVQLVEWPHDRRH
jgi:catechol 2,3-dioxygenase-like lactoylglutathione lyase family enzyme